MDRTNFIRYIMTATDRASRRVLAGDAAIRKSIKDTETASVRASASQSSAFSRTSRAAEDSSRRVVRSLDGQKRASREAREELRKFGFEQTRAWRAGSGFANHLRNTNLHLTRLRQSLRNLAVPALVAAFTTLAQAASTAGGGVIALASALRPLAGLAATLPGGILGIATAFGTLYAAIAPVKQAITDYQAMWKSAATTGASATNKLESASRALRSAHQAVADATLQVADSNRTLTDSQHEVEKAQNDLNRALSDGKRQLVDLKNAAVDAALGEQQASLTLRQAIVDLRKTETDPTSTMLEVEQAQLAVRQAKQGAKEARIEAARARAESAKAQGGGVEKLPDVISAKRALVDAERAQADASRGLAAAQRGVKRAVEGVKDAVVDSGEAAEQSASQVNNLAYDLAQLAPAGRQFAQFIAHFVKGPLLDLQKGAQTAFLPRLETGMKSAMRNMPIFAKATRTMGGALGYVSERAGKLIGSPGFGKQLDKVSDSNARVMRILGRAAISVAHGLMTIAVAARPLTTWLAHLVKGWADTFAATEKAKKASGELGRSFEDTKGIVQRLVHIVSNLWGAFSKIMDIAKPLGDSMFAAFDKSSRKFKEWTDSAKGETTIEKFFKSIKPALFEAGRLMSAIVKDIARMGMTSGLAPLLKQMRTELLPAVMEVSVGFSAAFGPGLIELLTSALGLFDALGHPLTVMLTTLARIVDAFAFMVKEVPGLKQLLGVMIGIGLAAKAISFASAVTGISTLVTKMRDLRALNATALASGSSRTAAATSAVAHITSATGELPSKPLYVWVVNEVGGMPVGVAGKGGRTVAKGQMTLPGMGVAATTVGEQTAATSAARGGLLSRAGGVLKSGLRNPKVALGAGAIGTAALIGGSMIPGEIPGSGVGIGEAVSNIGGGAAMGFAVGGPIGAAIGGTLGAIITFKKQVKEGLEWVVDFVKKHAALVAIALVPLTGGFSIAALLIIKFRKQIVAAIGDAFQWIENAANNTVDFFVKLPGRIVDGVKALPGLLLQAFQSIPYVLGRLVGFFLTLPFRIGAIMVKLQIRIVKAIIDLAPKLFHFGVRAVTFLAKAWWEGEKMLIRFWLSLPGRVIAAAKRLPGLLWDFGKKALSKLWGGMKNEAGGMLDFVKSLPGKIIHAISSLASKIYDAGKKFAKEFAKGVHDALPGPIRDAIDWSAGAVGDVVGAFGGGGGSETKADPRLLPKTPKPTLPGMGPVFPGAPGGDKDHKKARKNWKDTADQVGKSADAIRKYSRDGFGNAAKSASSSSDKVRKSVQGNYGKAQGAASQSLSKMQGDTTRTFSSVVSTTQGRGGDFVRSLQGTMGAAKTTVYGGLQYINEQTNKSLKAFDAPAVNVKLKLPGKGKDAPKKAQGGTMRVPGIGLQDTVPLMQDHVAAMVAPGEDLAVINRHQRPLLDFAVANTWGVSGLDGFFGNFNTPHYAARGAVSRAARTSTRFFAQGGMYDPTWDPGSELIARSIGPAVRKWETTYGADITAGYDPGGGHVSPGHNVTGTATDVVPRGGWGGSAQSLFEKGLRYLTSRGFEVGYDGSFGTQDWAGHGPPSQAGANAHAHIEWEGNGTIANAIARIGAMIGGNVKPPTVRGKGATQRISQAAITKVAAAANKYLGKRTGTAGAGTGSMPPIKGVGKGSPAENMSLGQKMMFKYFPSWRGQFGSLRQLWTGESGWDEEAANPTSTAYGIPQNISPETYAPAGQAGAPSGGRKAAAQIWWGLNYIKSRSDLGSPARAYSTWLSRSPHWYNRGGIAKTGTAARGAIRGVRKHLGALSGKGFRAPRMPNIDSLYPQPAKRTPNTFARGGVVRFAKGTSSAAGSTGDAATMVMGLAQAIIALGEAARRSAQNVAVSTTVWKPHLTYSHMPSSAPFVPGSPTADARNINKRFGTSANAFPFEQYGFDPVEIFDWEKFKNDPRWKRSEKALQAAMAALGKIPTDKFKKWIPKLEEMNFKSLGAVMKRLKEVIEGQVEKVQKLIDEAREKESPGGKKITKAERKAIRRAAGAVSESREKQSIAKRIRAPLVRFHNAIQNESVGQLNATQKQIETQIAQVKKGGVKGRERQKLARLTAMMEDVTDTIVEHIQKVMEAAEAAVSSAEFSHNMANLGLEHLELEQQLGGTFETAAGKKARANYIQTQIIPALQAEGAALEQQLAAAREAGDTELARQIAEQIAAVQNGILKEQLAIQELSKEELEDLNDAITGTLGFEFNSQRFTDLVGVGIGA